MIEFSLNLTWEDEGIPVISDFLLCKMLLYAIQDIQRQNKRINLHSWYLIVALFYNLSVKNLRLYLNPNQFNDPICQKFNSYVIPINKFGRCSIFINEDYYILMG